VVLIFAQGQSYLMLHHIDKHCSDCSAVERTLYSCETNIALVFEIDIFIKRAHDKC